MSNLGTFALLAGYLLLMLAWGLILVSILQGGAARTWLAARICFFAAVTVVFWCSALLVVAFLVNDFSIRYVAEHSSTTTPWAYRLVAFWAGKEGSLLLWLFLMTTFSAVFLLSVGGRVTPRFQQHVMLTCATVSGILLALIVYSANPFAPKLFRVYEGLGLNRLLHDWAMVIHPPTWFAGLSALVVVFAIAMARSTEPQRAALLARWARIAWTLLTIGIGLGAVWAYDELGWGGYWGWDPVENASLFPWFACTVLIHYASKRAPIAGRTATLLAGQAFAAALLAGYLARSGLVASVHSFAPSPAAAVMLVGMLAVAVVTFWRARQIPGPWHVGGVPLLAASLVFSALAAVVLLGTLWPIWGRLIVEHPEPLTPQAYNQLAGPVGIVLLACLLWCTLARMSSDRRVFLEGVLSSVTTASVVCFCLWHLAAPIGVGKLLAGWLATAVAAAAVFDYSVRKRAAGARLGKLLGHLGVVLLAFGLAHGIGGQGRSFLVRLKLGETSNVNGMKITLEEFNINPSGHEDISRIDATVKVTTATGTKVLHPAAEIDLSGRKTHRIEIDFSTGLLYDIYAVFEDFDRDELTLQIRKNWLVSWVWAGLILLTAGGLVSLRRLGGRHASRGLDADEHTCAESDP